MMHKQMQPWLTLWPCIHLALPEQTLFKVIKPGSARLELDFGGETTSLLHIDWVMQLLFFFIILSVYHVDVVEYWPSFPILTA